MFCCGPSASSGVILGCSNVQKKKVVSYLGFVFIVSVKIWAWVQTSCRGHSPKGCHRCLVGEFPLPNPWLNLCLGSLQTRQGSHLKGHVVNGHCHGAVPHYIIKCICECVDQLRLCLMLFCLAASGFAYFRCFSKGLQRCLSWLDADNWKLAVFLLLDVR